MSLRQPVLALVGAFVLLSMGCRGSSVPKRMQVHPISGQLFVNGQPGTGIVVNFHRSELLGPDAAVVVPTGMVDSNGNFAATTFVTGDGLPPGDYAMTFSWRAFRPIGSSFSGPDKLGGQFEDPKKSTHKVTVTNGPVTIPRIDLKATIVEEKPAPAALPGKGGGEQKPARPFARPRSNKR